MKKVVFVTSREAVHGFRLAGITQMVAGAGETERLLSVLMADSGTGVIVIEEGLTAEVGRDRMREMERRWRGLLVVLPEPGTKGGGRDDYLVALMKRVIGYHVRITA